MEFKMQILPAIDIKDGKCVRLFKGDFATVHKVAESPYAAAADFKKSGASFIHMVDLDGARDAAPKNSEIFIKVARESGLKVELGGGIRTLETVAYYLENGISRVILGSAALQKPALVREAVKHYPESIAVGIDAKNGIAAAEGWTRSGGVNYIELAKSMEQTGVKYIIFTDISRDGMLKGPNFDQLFALCGSVSCNIIASGGISSLADIIKLKAGGIYGAICGKAVYTGDLDLHEAVRIGEGDA